MLKVLRKKKLLKVVKRVTEVVKALEWKRRVVGFTAVARKRSFRVKLLFGGDRVEKLKNIVIGKAVEVLFFEVKWITSNYKDLP